MMDAIKTATTQRGGCDFIIIGAVKSGTTWLADMLRQHPEIYLPEKKEVHYFNKRFAEFPELDNLNNGKPIEWYLDFFKGAKSDQIRGE
ncbi:MAG: sulfotransferase, partial [Anaerolineae bacterium]|nr:sulfotransferase [Anaerolineae bacterium]